MALSRHTKAQQHGRCPLLQYQRCLQRACRPSVATHVVVEGQATSAPPAPMPRPARKPVAKNLKGPNVIRIHSTLRKEAVVSHHHDPGADVGTYMRDFANNFSSIELPLGGGMIRRSAEVFEITIPRFQLFDVTIQPRVQCDVRSDPTLVDVRSRECTITGSSHVERMRLNDRFDLTVDVAFSWLDPAVAAGGSSAATAATASLTSGTVGAAASAPAASASSSSSQGSSGMGSSAVSAQAAAQSGGQMNGVSHGSSGMNGAPKAAAVAGSSSSSPGLVKPLPPPRLVMNAELNVSVDVPMPFSLVPKGVMEPTCNAVMKTTLTVLLNAFAESLSADYAQWSVDPRMRAAGPRDLKLRKGSAVKR